MWRIVEVTELTGLPGQTLRDWITQGRIVPAYPGGRGKGKQHRFSHEQLIGLTVAAACLRSEIGCGHDYAARAARMFGDMDDRALMAWLRQGGTPEDDFDAARSEEAIATVDDSWLDRNATCVPGHDELRADIDRSLAKVEAFIQLRILQEEGDKRGIGEETPKERAAQRRQQRRAATRRK